MMRTLISLVPAALAGAMICLTVEQDPPFARLERQVKSQWGGWAGDKRQLFPLFNEERKRLGDRFEKELLKFVGSDVSRHCWVSAFLTCPSYLEGNDAKPQLALLILEQALAIMGSEADPNKRHEAVRAHVCAAVLSKRLGLHFLAASHKRKACELRGAYPAMPTEDRRIYESIATQPSKRKARKGKLP